MKIPQILVVKKSYVLSVKKKKIFSRMPRKKRVMVCQFALKKRSCELYKIIENARQQGKILFDKSKNLYNKLNLGNIIFITISNNTDFEVNENVNFPNFVKNDKLKSVGYRK